MTTTMDAKTESKERKKKQQQQHWTQKLQSLVFTITGWWTNNWLARVTLRICIRDCLITCSFITLLFIAMRSSCLVWSFSDQWWFSHLYPKIRTKSSSHFLLKPIHICSPGLCIISKMLFSGIYIHTIHVPKTIPWTYEYTTYHPIY